MADSTSHTTLAGARLDPNLNPEGQGISSGAGAIDSDRVHQEGIDHIKANSGLGSTSTPGSALPASNPSSTEDGGLGTGQGGVSSSAYVNSPVSSSSNITTTTVVTTTEEQQASVGIFGTVKSYLGFGDSSPPSTITTTTTTTTYHNPPADGDEKSEITSHSSVTDAEPIENAAISSEQKTATSAGSDVLPATSSTSTGSGQQQGYLAAAGGALASAAAATGLYSRGSTDTTATGTNDGFSSTDNTTSRTGDGLTSSNDGFSSTGNTSTRTGDDLSSSNDARRVADSTADSVDPHSTDAGTAGAGKADVGEEDKPPKPADGSADKDSDVAASRRENKSAIPTAGGQRLGEQHWGESQKIPDLPPQADEETSKAGISSSDGQPTSQVRDNTALNQGSATGGPGAGSAHGHGHGHDDSHTTEDGEGKQKFTDKIKEKLHIGSNN